MNITNNSLQNKSVLYIQRVWKKYHHNEITKLYSKLLDANSTEDFKKFYNNILTELNNKGKYFRLSKRILLQKSKEKRNQNNKLWTKEIAHLFGRILKLLKKIEKYSLKNKKELYNNCYHLGTINDSIYLTYNIQIKITQVCCGGIHLLFLTENNKVYSCGKNSFGCLGIEDIDMASSPVLIENLPLVKYISCGYAFSNAISISGELYSWGACENGRLASLPEDDNQIDIHLPVKVKTNVKIKMIQSGSVHSCGISETNNLYSWGHSSYNGHDKNIDCWKPRIISQLKDLLFSKISIGVGGYHTMALTVNGLLYTWGHNRVGQLGYSNPDNNNFILKVPKLVTDFEPFLIQDISAGWGNSMVIYNKRIWICGRNDLYQIGIDKNESLINERGHPYVNRFKNIEYFDNKNIKSISSGGSQFVCIDNDGNTYTWGCNISQTDENVIFPPILLGNTYKYSVLGTYGTFLFN